MVFVCVYSKIIDCIIIMNKYIYYLMEKVARLLWYGSLAGLSWVSIGKQDVSAIKDLSYDGGRAVSQNFKSYPVWDTLVEPALVKQFTVLFGAGYYFILGMTSDNTNMKTIQSSLKEMEHQISEITHSKTSNKENEIFG